MPSPAAVSFSGYSGRQLFFYKRAQIFVGDVWGAFHGAGLGRFTDIDQLTMFAGRWQLRWFMLDVVDCW